MLPIKRLRYVAVVAAFGLAVAGCGSGSRSTGTAAPASGTSTGKAATGAPLNFYWINSQGSTNGASYPQQTEAAHAAADYINKTLGGVDGRPLKLTDCFETSNADTQNCANEAVAAKPLAILLGTLEADNLVFETAKTANVPLLANSAFTEQTLTGAPHAYVFNASAAGSLLAIAQFLQSKQVKDAAMVYVNVPGAVASVQQAAPVYKKVGISLQTIPVPYPSVDLTATFSALLAKKPSAIIMLADPQTCTAAMKAKSLLGYNGMFLMVGSCNTPGVFSAGGAAAKGVYVTSADDVLNSSDPDVKVYKSAMAKYAPTDTNLLNTESTNGFQTIMDLYEILKAIPAGTPITSGNIVKQVQTGSYHQFLLGPDFTCNGKAFPGLSAACSIATSIDQYNGTRENFVVAENPSSLVQPASSAGS